MQPRVRSTVGSSQTAQTSSQSLRGMARKISRSQGIYRTEHRAVEYSTPEERHRLVGDGTGSFYWDADALEE